MRKKFREFYKATNEEMESFWQNAIFSFDANVLLNLYRYTENTRNEILDILQFLVSQNRVWISYQAAFEYQRNRLIVINNINKTYDSLIDILSKKKNDINSELNNYKKHPYLEVEDIKHKLQLAFEEINKELNELKDNHPDFLEDDPIFGRITELLEDCIGNSLNSAELTTIYKEGKERYDKKIPPGYMDNKEKEKNGEQSLYGDLIIWKELIKRFKKNQDKLIFVTDDLKEDWWYIFNGKTIYPRPELIREFIDETEKELIIYKPEQFLHFSKIYLNKTVKDATLKEVVETRKIDEISSNYIATKLQEAQAALQALTLNDEINKKMQERLNSRIAIKNMNEELKEQLTDIQINSGLEEKLREQMSAIWLLNSLKKNKFDESFDANKNKATD
jgi:hypothetical protein